MNFKKMTAIVVGGAMLCSLTALAAPQMQAISAPAAQTDEAPAVIAPEILPERTLYYGTIAERLTDETGALTGLRMESEADGEYVFHIDGSTLLLDSGAGIPAQADGLTVGTGVYVFHSPAVTMSLPPQSYAEAIVWNMPMDAGAAMLHTVEAVERHADGSLTITTDRGGLRLHLPKDAQIQPFMTRQIVSAEDIRVGTRLFAWYTAVQESDPAQTSASKVVLVPAAARELPLTVNGQALEGVMAKTIDGTLMVPASAAGKALGFTATHSKTADSETVTLKNDKTEMRMEIGMDSFTVEGDMVLTFGTPAVIEAPGVTWMPAEALAELAGAQLSLVTGTLDFTTAQA